MFPVRPTQFLIPAVLLSAAGWLMLGAPMVGAQPPGRGGRSGPVYAGWTSFFQPQYGFQLPVPPGMRAQGDPFTAKRAVFSTGDGDFTVTARGGFIPGPTRPTLEQQWMDAQSIEGRRVDYRRWGGSWFELSGMNRDGRAFFEKMIRRGEYYAVFTATYPPSRMEEFRPWMDEISGGFTYEATPPPVRIDPDPEGVGRQSGFRRFWAGLTDERPVPRAEPRRLEPWDGGGGRRGDSSSYPAEKPDYTGSGTSSRSGSRSSSTGPVDLTPPPPSSSTSAVKDRDRRTSDRDTPPESASSSRTRDADRDRSAAPVPPLDPSETSLEPSSKTSTKSGTNKDSRSPEKGIAKDPAGEKTTPPSSASGTPASGSQSSSPSKRDDLPFGTPIPGKKGFVYSPWNPGKGPVDVQDIPTGTKVRCPYTGKIFRVP